MSDREQLKRLHEIAKRVTYKPWYKLQFEFEYSIDSKVFRMTVVCRQPDANGEQEGLIAIHRDHGLHPDRVEVMTDDEIVQMLYDEITAIELHEAGEWFRYRGEKKFDPHT